MDLNNTSRIFVRKSDNRSLYYQNFPNKLVNKNVATEHIPDTPEAMFMSMWPDIDLNLHTFDIDLNTSTLTVDLNGA